MNTANLKTYLKVKDYSVSGETFDLLYNPDLDMLLTHPQPTPQDLPRYYDSPDYISHTDGKRSLFEKLYHLIKKIALKNKLSLINSYSSKGALLDIGAGTGDFLLVAKYDGWQITGIEPSEKAKNIALKKDVHFVDDLSKIPDHSFDVITMWHVLEHVPDLDKQLLELKRICKINGSIFIAVPNFKSFDANYYGEYWAAFDVPIHLWHFSKTAIKKLFMEKEMTVTNVLPMKFDSFYVSLLSEKYKTGKMNFIKAFLIGLRSNWAAKKSFEHSSHIYVIKNKQNAF